MRRAMRLLTRAPLAKTESASPTAAAMTVMAAAALHTRKQQQAAR